MLNNIDASKYSPVIRQYLDIKKDYTNAIVFFRLGDFYEMFFDDALCASKELEITLTGKDAGAEERVPMCGIPSHSYIAYAEKLIQKGYKVALVEQIEDASESKGLVKRGVVQVLTPGSLLSNTLDPKNNNYIASIDTVNNEFVFSFADVSTGELYVSAMADLDIVLNEIINLNAKEVITKSSFNFDLLESLKTNYNVVVSHEENTLIPSYLSDITNVDNQYKDGLAILLNYLIGTQKRELSHFQQVKVLNQNEFLRIDPFTKRNLELTSTLRQGAKNGSLLWHMDKCQTAMGSRLLQKWIDKPLVDVNEIEKRLKYVDAFNDDFITKEEIKNSLKTVYDLERILGRVSCGNANAKDLVQLRKTLSNVPNIKSLLSNLKIDSNINLSNNLDTHGELFDLLNNSLEDNPPLTIKEGNIIKFGYSNELDEIKSISNNSKDWIANFEIKEKERLGTKNLKTGYTRIHGYYIEITKNTLSTINEELLEGYERRQTLANAERFVTQDLKKYEQIVLGANEKIVKLEYELFLNIRNEAFKYIKSLQLLANILATIDVLISFSELSIKYAYVRPKFNNLKEVSIIDGKHPVLETLLTTGYVSNDIYLDSKKNMMIITGPNMSGKSTYMREFALIAIMAQMGCYVPASEANLMIFDQIFTRIGSSDDSLKGQSTFMVEMSESNYAISNATSNSLILFDEIGRGTSTFDGMALAQAILEYVHEHINCATLFSTHYHELVKLEDNLKKLKNVHVKAKETKDGIAFLHKVLDGPSDKSYGINVAKLAGLPDRIILRSKKLLSLFETQNANKNKEVNLFNVDDLYEEDTTNTVALEIKEDIKNIDLNKISPLDALNILNNLKNKIKE